VRPHAADRLRRFPGSDYPLAGRLELSAADDIRQLSIGCRDHEHSVRILVDNTVYAAGWGSAWVIAKRHPADNFGDTINCAVTEYYLVSVTDETAYGPFTDTQFVRERHRLGVDPVLDFTRYYRELDPPGATAQPAADSRDHRTIPGEPPDRAEAIMELNDWMAQKQRNVARVRENRG